jgi:hypothetical protein
MGGFMALFAIGTLAIGLVIDNALGLERRVATLICVLVGLPINLGIAIWLTKLLISRIIKTEDATFAAHSEAKDPS